MSVIALARPELLRLQPYSSARMEASSGSVWLNANELPWSPGIVTSAGLNRYPQPQPPELLDALAALYGVRAAEVFVGRGSDEAIDLLTRAFCAAGASNVVINPPTFGMYAVAARIQGAAVREVPLLSRQGYALDVPGILAAVTAQTRLVYVCTPNNPTGNAVGAEPLRQLAEALRGRALLVVDEAYAEFADAAPGLPLRSAYEHVVVLRTLSKAHGLAGARIGVAVADTEVIQLLRRIMAPYPLPGPSVAAALAALQPAALADTRSRVALLREERARLGAALAVSNEVIEVLPSQANFLAVRLRDPQATYERLAAAGIIVRSLSRYAGLTDALRFSVGTPDENGALLAALPSTAGVP